MTNPFNARAPSFDAESINETIQRALASAGLDTTSGPMQGVTETIRRALGTGLDQTANEEARISDAQEPGTFETHEFSNQGGMRSYKLYVPARVPDASPPMVVMLHGCTQSASDFAAGTQMNRLAEEHGFLVVYPEQPAHANPSKCWNWFRPQDQVRGEGEPSLIAGLVRDVASRHAVDPHRIFVAGLSAGAAMAVVLGETYPELFAGVGAHSGLPYGSAHDIPSAMAAMKGGRSGLPELKGMPISAMPRRNPIQAVPIIVFHGDRDHTVQQTNGSQIVRQAMDAYDSADDAGLMASIERGVAPGGRSYSREVHADANGQVHIESWTLHGAGHAWSGGHAGGSYTDNAGPDASAAMVRFFLALPIRGSA